MIVVRPAADNWNKIGEYEPIIVENAEQTHKWHIASINDWIETSNNTNSNIKYNISSLKYSIYNIRKQFDDVDVIWNTCSETVVFISKAETEILDNFICGRSIEACDFSLIEKLFAQGILVLNEDDEISKLHFIRYRSITNTSNIKSFIILPTTACNARCFYCFAHQDLKMSHKMTYETADDVLEFIYSRVKYGDEIVYRWFGGEPLMADDIIDYIVDNVNSHYQGNIKYHSIITTNASLLTESLLEKAIEKWHLRKIQIPLDGYQVEHNKRKNYREPQIGNYDDIIKKIESLLNRGIYTTCRLNLDYSNVSNIDGILKDLDKFKDDKRFFLHAIPLHTPKNTDTIGKYVYFTEYSEFYTHVYGKLVKAGFLSNINRILPKRTMSVCTAMLNNFALINSDGYLYRCDQELHTPENSVGTCKTGIIHNKNLQKWLDPTIPLECEQCEFLPICQGGCKFYRFRNDPSLRPCVEHKFISSLLLDITYDLFYKQ